MSDSGGSGGLRNFLGTVHAGIAPWLDIIPGHHNLLHLQRTVLLGITWILCKVMSSSV